MLNRSKYELCCLGKTVPSDIRADVLWTIKAYRLSLFLSDITWLDIGKLAGATGMKSLSDQLYRSVGSICANIEEGYSKFSTKDTARFYEYALGSARESRGWYYRARHILGVEVTDHRMAILTDIIRLLLTMVPDQRGASIKEDSPEYLVLEITDIDVPFNYSLLNTDYDYEQTRCVDC